MTKIDFNKVDLDNKDDYKICSDCGLNKHLTEYHRDKSTKDGWHHRCKLCKNAFSKRHIKLKKKFEALAEYHHIQIYPALKKGIYTSDIKCEKCGHFKSPSIMFENIYYYRKKEDEKFVCRECIATNSDDIAYRPYQAVAYITNKEIYEENKKINKAIKKEKKLQFEHWKAFCEDSGIDTTGFTIKTFDDLYEL